MSQFFKSGGLSIELQHKSFQWIFRTDFLQDWLVWSPFSPRDSQESSPTPQFKSINSLVLILYGPTLLLFLNYTWKSLLIHYVLHMWQTNTPLNFQNFCLITFFQNIWVLLICSKLFQTVINEANIYETEVSRTALGPRALFMFYSFLYRWLL